MTHIFRLCTFSQPVEKCVPFEGEVLRAWPAQNEFIIKIQDGGRQPNIINICFRDRWAGKFSNFTWGDEKMILKIRGAKMEPDPQRGSHDHPLQVIISEAEADVKVLIQLPKGKKGKAQEIFCEQANIHEIIEFTEPSQRNGVNGQPSAPERKRKAKTTPQTDPKKSKSGYYYTSLSDLEINTTANVYGVISSFSPVKITGGTDMMLNMIMVDESVPNNSSGVGLNIFAPSRDMFPAPQKPGDIIRLHRTKFEEWPKGEGKAHGVAKLREKTGKYGGIVSFLIFDGRRDGSLEPYSKGKTKEYTITDTDKTRIQALREWSENSGLFGPPILNTPSASTALSRPALPATSTTQIHNQSASNQPPQPLPQNVPSRNISAGSPCRITDLPNHRDNTRLNLTCRVISRLVDTNYHTKLIVWDSTEVPSDCNLELDDATAFEDAPFRPPEIFTPLLGSKLIIHCWDNKLSDLSKISNGEWIRIHNLQVNSIRVASGAVVRKIDARNDCVIRALPSNHEDVLAITREYDEALAILEDGQQTKSRILGFELESSPGHYKDTPRRSTKPPITMQPIAPTSVPAPVSHPPSPLKPGTCAQTSLPFSSIVDVLNTPPPYEFKCRVRVTRYSPEMIEQMAKPCCPHCMRWLASKPASKPASCDFCKKIIREDSSIFVLKLTLTDLDNSGSLDALVCGSDAETFLGFQATDLSAHHTIRNQVAAEIQTLLQPNSVLHCCLKSYTNDDVVKYRVFDTIFLRP